MEDSQTKRNSVGSGSHVVVFAVRLERQSQERVPRGAGAIPSNYWKRKLSIRVSDPCREAAPFH